jgi:hypothetical protein
MFPTFFADFLRPLRDIINVKSERGTYVILWCKRSVLLTTDCCVCNDRKQVGVE